jgi:dihydroorotate dehydrogenase
MLFRLFRPLLFALLNGERAHALTIIGLQTGLLPRAPAADPILATSLAGMALPNPVGMAAGFDKNGQVPDAVLRLGFGFTEVGTVTPRPQDGNPRPRIFRLVEDKAVINRLGFNNAGLDAAQARLAARQHRPGIVGINVGANKDSTDRIADYVAGVRGLGGLARYIAVNISSPNTPGLRGLQDRAALTDLLAAVVAARSDLANAPPLFVKVAPDLTPAEIDDIADVALASGIDGLIVSNTTLARPSLHGGDAGETGGLSGAPLLAPSTGVLRAFARATAGKLPLIGVGGIASGADAYAKLRAGASAVQLYTGMVYDGPGIAARVCRDLAALLRRDGFTSVAAAVGVDA